MEMPSSLTDLVYKRRKDRKKLSEKVAGKKKKHKKLDAICEDAYNRSHEKKVERVELRGEDEMEPRRSGRARKAPVMLDSSPPPPRRKRRKVGVGLVSSSAEKVYSDGGVGEGGAGCETVEEMDGESIGGWRSRLRSVKKDDRVSGRRRRGESSVKGKRKLFEDLDGFEEAGDTVGDDEEDELVIGNLAVAKSERPGRIKGSNVLASGKGKMKLFKDLDGLKEASDTRIDDKEDELVMGNLAVARSERPERIKCSNVLASGKGKMKLFKDLDGLKEASDTRIDDKEDELVMGNLSVARSERPERIKCSNVLASGKGKMKLFKDLDGLKEASDTHIDDKEDELVMGNFAVARSERPERIKDSNVLASGKGKRKHFKDLDGLKEASDTRINDREDGLVKENSTVAKSERPERIKASNVLANEPPEINVAGDAEDHDGSGDDVPESIDNGAMLTSSVTLGSRKEAAEQDGCMASMSSQIGEIAVPNKSQVEKCVDSVNLETSEVSLVVENMVCDLVPDERDATEQLKDGLPSKSPEDETCKSDKKDDWNNVADQKPRIKLGRHCGLCGCGTDGKPPKLRQLEGYVSDNVAYSGASDSEEPKYDVWDGFGDEPGWLGRLLGPINDRFGIAGIWVHQQCAVWSPEVYFAGLGCLKNVRAALYRGRVLKCSRCRRPGATIGCRVDRCPKTYHVPCARAKGCIFDHRKFLIACTDHRHLFQPYGLQNAVRLKKMKAKRLKLELRKMSNDACRKDIEAEEKLLEKCGEDEEFLRRESKRLQRDLCRIAPVYIGGANSENDTRFQGWESVAGLQHVIQCMKEVVIIPLLYPEFFSNLGVTPPRGILLHGYPGTGKTLVVRALVGSCARGDKRIAYFARKGADCLGKYVGDAERQLRLLFQVAEKSQPSIIFFDEIDGLAPCRTKQQDQTHSSVVSTLLALMDGLKSRGSVVVIGATNRPDAVDPALRRPGRFDREIYFPLPSLKDRESILSLHTQKWPKPIAGSLLKLVANQTIGFAGADLQALCTQAAIIALRKNFPLQDVLSAAESTPPPSKCPSIPNFYVEERDWLQALSCAPPPCSRREFSAAVNDVVASPLDTFLVPCLLQPLIRLLIRFSLEDCIWLPRPLTNAFKLVKNVIFSSLSSRGMQRENWLAHVDDLLQDVNFRNEIEKNLLCANGLVRQNSLCSDVIEEFNDEFCPRSFSSNSQFMGSSGLVKNMSCPSSNKSGFQMLISGKPRSGQRHLASCLLHCFIGKVDVWKVDLASISLEGHGDMSHGLNQLLMRCAGADSCMIYMPRIDLWAIETCNEASDESHESESVNLQSTGTITCNGSCETAGDPELFTGAEVELKKASCLWTSFIDQVESMRVNTSVIVLATSELPFSVFPDRVRQFFGDEIVNCSLSNPMNYKVPRFCVQLDEMFDCDKVVKAFATKLSQDLAQHFVQSVYNTNHNHENSSKEKVYNRVQDTCHSKSSPVCPLNPVPITNKMVKGRSNLLLAISTIGHQILCYPHFAELCWVTSKLKAGPFANVNGPWKGWPFNSCVIGPINSTEQAVTASGPSIVKSKKFGIVRGLVAIGLLAYKGEYTSPREICVEVRKVLETLVGRIEDKIQAGKDKRHFIRLLSQVAYLEDLVTSWAYSLRSLEAEVPVSHENKGSSIGLVDNHASRKSVSEGNDYEADTNDVFMQDSDMLEHVLDIDVKDGEDIEPTNGDNLAAGVMDTVKDGGDIKPIKGGNLAADVMDIDIKDVGDIEPANGDNIKDGRDIEPTAHGYNLGAGDQVEVNMDKSSDLPVSDHSMPVRHSSSPNDVSLESSKDQVSGDPDNYMGNFSSAMQSNGVTGSSSGGPVEIDGIEILSPVEDSCQPNDLSSSDNNIVSTNTLENLGGTDPLKPASPSGFSSEMCFYQCCSECFMNLQSTLLTVVTSEWGLKGGVDTTVEDVYHFLASLSVKFNLALCKFSQAETLSGIIQNEHSKYRNCFECQKCKEAGLVGHMTSIKELMMECGCHTTGEISPGNGCSFFFKNGVLGSSDTSEDVPYHCKFEKVCLCFLTEWLVTSKELFV